MRKTTHRLIFPSFLFILKYVDGVSHIRKISVKSNMTTSHAYHTMRLLEQRGFVTIQKKGLMSIPSATERCKSIQAELITIQKVLKEPFDYYRKMYKR